MEKTIECQGCQVAYQYLRGEAPLTIILLHGYGLHRDMWQPQIELLQQQGYPALAIDIRGHGKSRPTTSFTVRLAAEDLAAIIQAEQLEHYLLSGLSMGAFVVQEYALLFGGAQGYMLTGVTPLCLPYAAWEKWLLGKSGAMMRYLYSWQGLKKAMAKTSTATDAAREQLVRMFDEMNKQEFLVSWQGFTTCLHEADLQFDAPLLVVAGEEDSRGTIKQHLPDWQQHYPGCQLQTIAGAGHVANLDQVDEFNQLLLDFIARCTETGKEE